MTKYEFTGETKQIPGGHTLRQIRRLSDNLIGGWIESENNLAQEGKCWVHEDAHVCGNARVTGNAQLYNASLFGDTWIHGDMELAVPRIGTDVVCECRACEQDLYDGMSLEVSREALDRGYHDSAVSDDQHTEQKQTGVTDKLEDWRKMTSRDTRHSYDVGDYWNVLDEACDRIQELEDELKSATSKRLLEVEAAVATTKANLDFSDLEARLMAAEAVVEACRRCSVVADYQDGDQPLGRDMRLIKALEAFTKLK